MKKTMPAKSSGNSVATERARRGWSQQELADKIGLSRAAISAVEIGRAVPSVSAAIELARVLDCTVEELFGARQKESTAPVKWFGDAPPQHCRYWSAEVHGATIRIPVEVTHAGEMIHHGTWDGAQAAPLREATIETTLVMAGCDPAAALFAAELRERHQVNLIPLVRSTGDAVRLLDEKKVHVGGLHAGTRSDANRRLVHERLGKGYMLLRIARWEEGVALGASVSVHGLNDAALHRLAWVNREKGSGARRCMDELLHGVRVRPAGYDRVVFDHRSVAAAVKGGWADAGVCIRLAAEEAGLGFLTIQREPYDLCFHESLQDDPRIRALIECVRSARIRRAIADLPGYFAEESGELHRATA